MENIGALLKENSYPGRGIIIGKSQTENKIMIFYFIMGRSENSRNRVFTLTEDGIITEAADPAKMQDPSLIIYAPVKKFKEQTVVTNGDQTDTIVDFLQQGGTFEEALRTRTFEPDEPNYTPRISGIVTVGLEGFSYKLSILKSANGNPDASQRFFYEYDATIAGLGHFIHTYKSDGNPLPSFAGEPVSVCLEGALEEIGKAIWESLHPENKVALFCQSIALDGSEQTLLYNRFSKI